MRGKVKNASSGLHSRPPENRYAISYKFMSEKSLNSNEGEIDPDSVALLAFHGKSSGF